MSYFYARILPDNLSGAISVGKKVPLIVEHDIFGKRIGNVFVLDGHFAIIESDELKSGDKLSSGVFLVADRQHDIREVSLVAVPRFNDCEVLREASNDEYEKFINNQ